MSENQNNVYEMLWDCQFCGTDGNLGLTHRFCPNCGAPQNPDARYFPSDEDKVAVHDHKYVGVDVTCPNCDELNSAASEHCGQCGAPLTEGAKARMLEARERADAESFESSGSRDVVKEAFDAEMQRVGVQESPKRKRSGPNWMTLAVIGLIIAAAAGVFGFFNLTEETEVVVTGHEWERSIQIDEYRAFSVRSWRDSPPAGENLIIQPGSCRQEQRSTRRVPDGEECRVRQVDQGDGTFREERVCETTYRTEAVYDDMCTWSGTNWMSDRTERTSGTSVRETPVWPDITLNCAGQRQLGCERESGRNERYSVLYEAQENSNNYRCNYPQERWASIAVGSVWVGQVRVVDGGGLSCNDLQSRITR